MVQADDKAGQDQGWGDHGGGETIMFWIDFKGGVDRI